jgi:hypothetical protein
MKTTILTIVMALISMTAYAQKFTYFNEGETIPGLIKISPKNQTKIYYKGSDHVFYIDDKVGIMKEMAAEFFQTFNNIKDSEIDNFSKLSVQICFSGKFKTDYVAFKFKDKYKSFMLKNEKKFYDYAMSIDMTKHKHLLYYKETFAGGTLEFPIKSFIKYRDEVKK